VVGRVGGAMLPTCGGEGGGGGGGEGEEAAEETAMGALSVRLNKMPRLRALANTRPVMR
jgi:hypothetical protein